MSDPHLSNERPSLMRELWIFMRQNKKWWLAPLLLMIVLLGFLVVLSGSPAAIYIYSLF